LCRRRSAFLTADATWNLSKGAHPVRNGTDLRHDAALTFEATSSDAALTFEAMLLNLPDDAKTNAKPVAVLRRSVACYTD
jgi:hypothetical protein